MTPREEWDAKGYSYVSGFFGLPLCLIVQNYLFLLKNCSDRGFVDNQSPLSWSIYGDPLLDTLMCAKVAHVSDLMGERMLPSYTYARIYAKGDRLPPHRDRPSCEVSLTCTIGIPDGRISDICFKKVTDRETRHALHEEPALPPDLEEDATRISIAVGDALLYDGCGYWHWREPIENEFYVQLFIHYVRKNGPYAEEYFRDGRPNFGYPHISRDGGDGSGRNQPA